MLTYFISSHLYATFLTATTLPYVYVCVFIPYAYGTYHTCMVCTIRVRYKFVYHMCTVWPYAYGMYHMRITIYYMKILASRFKVELALTATVSLSPGLATFYLHVHVNLFQLFDLAIYN